MTVLSLLTLWRGEAVDAGEINPRLHGAPYADANFSVQSLQERKYANLVRQQYDFSCGAAAVATILRYGYGLYATETQVIEGLMTVSDEALVRRQGFSLLGIKQYVERLGFRGRGYQVTPATLSEVKVPTIVLVDINGYKHFVVLRKVAGDLAFIADPALGNRAIPLEEFFEGWEGIVFAIIGPGYNRFAKLANPEPPLSLRLDKTEFLPTSAVELFEFGFRREELF